MSYTSWLVLILFVAAVYWLTRKEAVKEANSAKEQAPSPAPVAPSPVSFVGEWVFDIIPPDRGKWGDGSHPDEKIPGKAEKRSDWAPGLQWRLDGDGSFVRDTQGNLLGTAFVCGAKVRINAAVPINGGAVGLESDGVYLEFHFDGIKLSGKVHEPHDPDNKYGMIQGRRIA